LGADVWTETAVLGIFHQREFTQDDAIKIVALKILYAELGKPKIIVNRKNFSFSPK
jgi:hypothetical protein